MTADLTYSKISTVGRYLNFANNTYQPKPLCKVQGAAMSKQQCQLLYSAFCSVPTVYQVPQTHGTCPTVPSAVTSYTGVNCF